MAVPAAMAVKAAVAIVSDKKLRNFIGGIILGIIVIIVAPIVMLLSLGSTTSQINWNSAEMQQQILDSMSEEQKVKLEHFADVIQKIEDEITLQGLDIEPIKAQVIFLCELTQKVFITAYWCWAWATMMAYLLNQKAQIMLDTVL